MLSQDTGGIVHRHFIAGESDQPRTAFDVKSIKRGAQQRRGLMRLAHARLRRMAGIDRKRMKEEPNHIGAPLGGDCAAVSVPPSVCLPENVIPSAGATRAS